MRKQLLSEPLWASFMPDLCNAGVARHTTDTATDEIAELDPLRSTNPNDYRSENVEFLWSDLEEVADPTSDFTLRFNSLSVFDVNVPHFSNKVKSLAYRAKQMIARVKTPKEVWAIYQEVAALDDHIQKLKGLKALPDDFPLCYDLCGAAIEDADSRTRAAQQALKVYAASKGKPKRLDGLAAYICREALEKLKKANPVIHQVPFNHAPTWVQWRTAAAYAITH